MKKEYNNPLNLNDLPTIRFDFSDGAFGNFLVTPAPASEHVPLENFTKMKYGRKNAEKHTLKILRVLHEALPADHLLWNKIIGAAESVIANYYLRKFNSELLYDVERDEYVVCVIAPESYAVRITRIVRAVAGGYDYDKVDEKVGIAVTNENLVASLNSLMVVAVKSEEYEDAAVYRDAIGFVSTLPKKEGK